MSINTFSVEFQFVKSVKNTTCLLYTKTLSQRMIPLSRGNEMVFLYLTVESTSADLEPFRGSLLVPSGLIKYSGDESFFTLIQRDISRYLIYS